MTAGEAKNYMVRKEPSADAAYYCFIGMAAFLFTGLIVGLWR